MCHIRGNEASLATDFT